MAQEQQSLAYGQSFRSSFGQLTSSASPHALSFTSRSVVGTLDAENPFGTLGASFHGTPSSFRMPPPDPALAAELYKTVPMAASSLPSSPMVGPPGTTLLDTATGPAGAMSPLGTATGPAGLLSPMGTMTAPAFASTTMGSVAPLTVGTFSQMAPGAPPPPLSPTGSAAVIPVTGVLQPGIAPAATQSVVIPTTGVLQPSQGLATATFGASPGVMMVPPTAPTFASMPVIGQAAPLTMPTMSMPAAVPATSSVTSQYAVGTPVEHLSDETGTWVKAVVQGFNESTSQYVLDIGVKAPAQKLRPAGLFAPVPTPPASGVVTIAAVPQEASMALLPPPPSAAPITTIAAQPAYYTVNQPATQMATVVQSTSLTNLTTSVTANPFASAAFIAGPSQSLSSTSVPALASTVMTAPFVEAAALPIPAQPSSVMVRPIGTTMGPPVVTVAEAVPASPVATLPAVATPVSTTLSLSAQVLDPIRVASSSVSAPPVAPVAPVAAAASMMAASSVAQGDMYTVPPEDVWIPVGQPGQPAVRVEPNWREGQWWYTTAVDFKGLERCPMGSKQDTLVLADESLLQMEENGEIPPLPAPKAWSETDTCPIT